MRLCGNFGWILDDKIRDKIADRMAVISVFMVTTDKKIRSRKTFYFLPFCLPVTFGGNLVELMYFSTCYQVPKTLTNIKKCG